MAGIQQNFQNLFQLQEMQDLFETLKKNQDRFYPDAQQDKEIVTLVQFVRELAHIAGVLSSGELIKYAADLQGIPLKNFSPRHEFLKQFDVALQLLSKIQQDEKKFQVSLSKYPCICTALQELTVTLNQQIQNEIKRYSKNFQSSYQRLSEMIVVPEKSPSITVDAVRKLFGLPIVANALLTELKDKMLLRHSSVGSQKDSDKAKQELMAIVNGQDQERLEALAQAGDADAIEKLYVDSNLKTVGCHLVQAVNFSNLTGLEVAIKLIGFSTLSIENVSFLLRIAIKVFEESKITLSGKLETKNIFYDKVGILKNPDVFLFHLLAIEVVFLKLQIINLQKQDSHIADDKKRNILFTAGYLIQLACVNLYEYFREKPSCERLCEDLLCLRREIGGEGCYYYVAPEAILAMQSGDKLALETLSSSTQFDVVISDARNTCRLL